MKSDTSIGFAGAGNMATALIKGIINSKSNDPAGINVFDTNEKKLLEITKKFQITGKKSNIELVRDSDIIILAVKPQVIKSVLDEIRGDITRDHLVISIAAGVTINTVQSVLGDHIPVIRVMPNTPALIQMGMSAISSSRNCGDNHRALADHIFQSVGATIAVEEEMMDSVTALSGSGPGFIFRIMECFVDAGESCGFERDKAIFLTFQTFLGAVTLAGESDLSLSKLREMVTSPGGTTEAGLSFLDKNNILETIRGTLKAARNRSIELGKNR